MARKYERLALRVRPRMPTKTAFPDDESRSIWVELITIFKLFGVG